MENKALIYGISELIDYAGVAIIAAGAAIALIIFARDLLNAQVRREDAYTNVRTFLGRSLLLGLEFLVAGDVIKTVAVEPTIDSVLVLAIIVLVRTVLSWSIDVEIDGAWPWQKAGLNAASAQPVSTEATASPVTPPKE